MTLDHDRLADRRFLVALGILLINDHVLKYAWPGWFTGKLSDLAGLFAFGWFWVALFPQRPRSVLSVVGLFFIWWKSPLSQPVIDGWNHLAFWDVQRVVDPSDLVALPVLCLVRPWKVQAPKRLPTWVSHLLAVGCLFTFSATSHRRAMMPGEITQLYYHKQTYTLAVTPAEFWERLRTCESVMPLDTVPFASADPQHHCLKNVRLREVVALSVSFVIWPRGHKTRLELVEIRPDHPIRLFSEEELHIYKDLYRRLFEQAVLSYIDRRAVPHSRWDRPVSTERP